MYADSEEDDTPKDDTPKEEVHDTGESQEAENSPDSQRSSEVKKSKKRSEPVNGAMWWFVFFLTLRDYFAKKVQKETPTHPGKRMVKKVREVTGDDGFSCTSC